MFLKTVEGTWSIRPFGLKCLTYLKSFPIFHLRYERMGDEVYVVQSRIIFNKSVPFVKTSFIKSLRNLCFNKNVFQTPPFSLKTLRPNITIGFS